MLNTKLEIVAVGEPNIEELPESQQKLFFETLLARVVKIKNEKTSACNQIAI